MIIDSKGDWAVKFLNAGQVSAPGELGAATESPYEVEGIPLNSETLRTIHGAARAGDVTHSARPRIAADFAHAGRD